MKIPRILDSEVDFSFLCWYLCILFLKIELWVPKIQLIIFVPIIQFWKQKVWIPTFEIHKIREQSIIVTLPKFNNFKKTKCFFGFCLNFWTIIIMDFSRVLCFSNVGFIHFIFKIKLWVPTIINQIFDTHNSILKTKCIYINIRVR